MSTYGGFGSLYYGWRHRPDGTSTATKWLAVFYIPVVPLRRDHVKVLTDFENDRIGVQSLAGGLLGTALTQTDYFQVLERLPLSFSEVGLTYAKTFLGLPLLMAFPYGVFLLVAKLIGPDLFDSDIGKQVAMGISFVCLANFLWWPIWAIRKSRGKNASAKSGAPQPGMVGGERPIRQAPRL